MEDMEGKPKTIQIDDFSKDLIRLFKSLSKKGWSGEVELSDLGDFIGRLLVTDANSTEELEDGYESFCNGLHHGLGLTDDELNTKQSVEIYLQRWEEN